MYKLQVKELKDFFGEECKDKIDEIAIENLANIIYVHEYYLHFANGSKFVMTEDLQILDDKEETIKIETYKEFFETWARTIMNEDIKNYLWVEEMYNTEEEYAKQLFKDIYTYIFLVEIMGTLEDENFNTLCNALQYVHGDIKINLNKSDIREFVKELCRE